MTALGDIPAFILAGGLGTRLRSVVSDAPKVMATVRERPFIYHLLDQLADSGVRNVVLGTGYMAEHVEEVLGESYRGMRLRFSREQEPLGTGGALRLALPKLDGDPVLVLNGDSFCGADLEAMHRSHLAAAAPGTMLLVHVDDARRFGGVRTDADDRIVRFDEKDPEAGAAWINAGIYLLSRELVAGIPTGRAVSLERECFPAWLAGGLHGHRTDAPLIDIGTPESYAAADSFFGR